MRRALFVPQPFLFPFGHPVARTAIPNVELHIPRDEGCLVASSLDNFLETSKDSQFLSEARVLLETGTFSPLFGGVELSVGLDLLFLSQTLGLLNAGGGLGSDVGPIGGGLEFIRGPVGEKLLQLLIMELQLLDRHIQQHKTP